MFSTHKALAGAVSVVLVSALGALPRSGARCLVLFTTMFVPQGMGADLEDRKRCVSV